MYKLARVPACRHVMTSRGDGRERGRGGGGECISTLKHVTSSTGTEIVSIVANPERGRVLGGKSLDVM